jgi:4-hydroxy-tetrahydrodipicolinate synthase
LHTVGRDFGVYSGIETLCYPMLTLGGAGHVSATGNIMPREVAELYNLCERGQWEKARDLHYHLLEINEILFVETNPAPVKAAMGMMSLIEPELRLPMAPISEQNMAKLRAVMEKYELIGD